MENKEQIKSLKKLKKLHKEKLKSLKKSKTKTEKILFDINFQKIIIRKINYKIEGLKNDL